MNVMIVLFSMVSFYLIFVGCATVMVQPENCDDLGKEAIKMTEESEGPFSPVILKLYDVREEKAEGRNILQCKARAKWSRGDEGSVRFFMEKYADGELFVGLEALD